MFDHVTIRVADLGESKRFYEAVFEPLGYSLSFGDDGEFWAFDIGHGMLFEIAQSQTGEVQSVHVAFRVPDRTLVDSFHATALTAGGTCNGPPGPRPNYTPTYYACFIHDPSGHNIEVMIDAPER